MKEVARSVGSVVQKHSGRDFKFSKNEKEAETLWQGRKVALWSAMSLLPGYKCWLVCFNFLGGGLRCLG